MIFPKLYRRFFDGAPMLRLRNFLALQPSTGGLLYCGNLRWRHVFPVSDGSAPLIQCCPCVFLAVEGLPMPHSITIPEHYLVPTRWKLVYGVSTLLSLIHCRLPPFFLAALR